MYRVEPVTLKSCEELAMLIEAGIHFVAEIKSTNFAPTERFRRWLPKAQEAYCGNVCGTAAYVLAGGDVAETYRLVPGIMQYDLLGKAIGVSPVLLGFFAELQNRRHYPTRHLIIEALRSGLYVQDTNWQEWEQVVWQK
ncbi:MAG TPA: hypothetical protein VEA59_04195 [Patescibacteria group bacterium]|nr:hypothetical protein [Patescibacteria group bacterium]